MGRRRTRCLTYGEMRDQEGMDVYGARAHFQVYVTLCGAPEDDLRLPEYAGHQDHKGPRPAGTCPRCWRVYRRAMQEAGVAPAAENVLP